MRGGMYETAQRFKGFAWLTEQHVVSDSNGIEHTSNGMGGIPELPIVDRFRLADAEYLPVVI